MRPAEINESYRRQLRENALLQGLAGSGLEELLDEIPLYLADANEVILTEVSAANRAGNEDVYLLLSGTVRIVRMLPDEREHPGAEMGPGTFFGEMAVFAPGPRSARVVAAEPAVVAQVNRAMLERIVELDPLTVVKTITRVLAERLREANNTIVATYMQHEKLAAIGSVVGQIAHDLKSPLSAVSGVADLMQDPLTRVSPERQAEILRRAVQSVTGLVEDILAFASDRPRRAYERVVVQDLLKNVEDFGLSPLERKGRIEIIREIEPVPDIVGDAVALERMLLNLIKNAGEAMTGRGTLVFRVREAEGCVEFVVQDTGTGIPEEVRGRLFQSFVTSGKPGGTGLGLAMVKRTVDAHRGTIEVESSERGTKFVVRIPCLEAKC